MRAFPMSRLEVISSFASTKEKHSGKNSEARVARAKKPAVKVRSIECP
jgi:hypothetical protein